MKSILSASVCVAALSLAIPAMAATSDTPKHMHHHHMSKMGPKTKMKKAGDPTTEQLNARSLDAARGTGAAPAAGDSSAAPMTPPAASSGAPMTPPSSGSTGTTAPMNAPSGG